MSIRLLTVQGRITREPEVRYTSGENPRAVLNLGIANSIYDPKATENAYGRKEQTLFFDPEVWGEEAERLAEHLHQGDTVTAVGELYLRTYEDKDGNTKTAYTLKNARIQLDFRKREEGETQVATGPQAAVQGKRQQAFLEELEEEPAPTAPKGRKPRPAATTY